MANGEADKAEMAYALAIRRECQRILIARENRDRYSFRNQMIAAFLAILFATERYTGAQIGTAHLFKPLLLACTNGADEDAAYDFLARFVTAIEERYKLVGVTNECVVGVLPHS